MIDKIQFSRAGRRRFNAQVRTLREMFGENRELFDREWRKLLQGWLNEAHRRAKNWAEGEEFRNAESREGIIERGRTHVFGLLENADALIEALGPEISVRVGNETRSLLTNECTKAVAAVVDHRLNYMVDHRIYRRRGK